MIKLPAKHILTKLEERKKFQNVLLEWYDQAQRQLPWIYLPGMNLVRMGLPLSLREMNMTPLFLINGANLFTTAREF